MAELNNAVAKHYAEAALQLATADAKVDRWLEDLQVAAEVLSDRTVRAALDSSALPERQKVALVRRSLGWLEPSVLNLVLLLVTRRRVGLLGHIATEFRRLVDARRGIVDVRVTTAVELDQAHKANVAASLSRALGRQVRLHLTVDPLIVGGLVVQVGDRVINGSVAGRLESLRRTLIA